MMVESGDEIVVWFSCGAASAVAAKATIKMFGARCKVRVINNPVEDEHADNRRFLRDIEKWLGVEIESCTNPKYKAARCEEVWESRKFMSGPMGAPCTLELKKNARKYWEKTNRADWYVLGFTKGEEKREYNFSMNEARPHIPILIKAGITKEMCFSIIKKAGIKLPAMYAMGFPNANCIGCVKASSPTYWNHVRYMFPDVFKARADLSERLGAKLVIHKGKRIPLHELPSDAVGRPLKATGVECGIFCDTGG